MPDITRTGFSRMFLLEQRAGPETAPQYQGVWKAGGITWDQGDITIIRQPSDTQYDAFTNIGKIIGAQGNPTFDITGLYPLDAKSTLFKLARRGCDNDLQIHIGDCSDPKDFNGGWKKIIVLEAARATSYSTEDLGALDTDERALVHETLPVSGEDLYEIVPIAFGTLGGVQITREVMDVAILDAVNCGACGLPSDGTSKFFALEAFAAGSPGANAQIVASQDGGVTIIESTISTLGAAQSARRLGGSGTLLVVVSDDSDSLHYIRISDMLRGAGAWSQVTTGFVATKGPRDFFSLGPSLNWMVGEGGYIYFSSDVTSGVTAVEQGSLTILNLNGIHGFDASNLVTVGDGNIVLVSRNGGLAWAAAPGGGPATGVNLNCVYMRGKDEWWVGSAAGRLYYTRDGGTTWREKAFPGNGSGQVRDITFPTKQVGYMSHDGATGGGRILRSISGGNSWYVTPEGTGNIPTNTRINQISATKDDPNFVLGGGIVASADGILVRGSGN